MGLKLEGGSYNFFSNQFIYMKILILAKCQVETSLLLKVRIKTVDF